MSVVSRPRRIKWSILALAFVVFCSAIAGSTAALAQKPQAS